MAVWKVIGKEASRLHPDKWNPQRLLLRLQRVQPARAVVEDVGLTELKPRPVAASPSSPFRRRGSPGPVYPAELLHVLRLPDFDWAERIGEFWGHPETRTVGSS
jgi:hypothetical protein